MLVYTLMQQRAIEQRSGRVQPYLYHKQLYYQRMQMFPVDFLFL